MEPLNGPEEWPKSCSPHIFAPPSKKPLAYRPTKKRRREAGELTAKQSQLHKLSKKGKRIKCSKCGQLGHNQSRCTTTNAPCTSQIKRKQVTSHHSKKTKESNAATTPKKKAKAAMTASEQAEQAAVTASKNKKTGNVRCESPLHFSQYSYD